MHIQKNTTTSFANKVQSLRARQKQTIYNMPFFGAIKVSAKQAKNITSQTTPDLDMEDWLNESDDGSNVEDDIDKLFDDLEDLDF